MLYKKTISFAVFSALLLLQFSCFDFVCEKVNASEYVYIKVLEDTFENDNVGEAPSGWYSRNPEKATVTVQEEYGNKFARVTVPQGTTTTNSAGNTPIVVRVIDEPVSLSEDHHTVIEARIRTNNTNFRKMFKPNYPTDTTHQYYNEIWNNAYTLFNIHSSPTSIGVLNGDNGTGNPSQPNLPFVFEYQTNEWYRIKAVLRTSEKKWDFYVYGDSEEYVRKDLSTDIWYMNEASAINNLTFFLRNAVTLSSEETLDFDNVKIYKYKAVDREIVTEIIFTNELGETIKNIEAGSVSCDFYVQNIKDYSLDVICVAALYNRMGGVNKLEDVLMSPQFTLEPSENITIELDRAIEVPNVEDYVIKIFVLSDLNELRNLSESIMFEKALEFFIATDGNDENEGTKYAPFATLERAKSEIRALKNEKGLPYGGVTVYIRGGKYEMTDSFNLLSQDSGTVNSPIVYKAYNGEKAIFIGGSILDWAMFEPITDSYVLNRIIDMNARSNILQINLADLGIHDYGQLNYPGAYVFPHVPDNSTSPELFFNNEPMTLARWPNDGYITITSVIHPGANPRNWESDKILDPNYVLPADRDPDDGFIIGYTDNRIDNWTSANDIRLYGFWRYNWADQTVKVKNIDTINKTIESMHPSYYSVTSGGRYYVYNLLEEIDMPGEYYLDREQGILYLYPPDTNENAEIYLSNLTEGINMKNTANVTIQDVHFTAVRGSAINIEDGENNLILNCTIKNTGDKAVRITGKNNGIMGSYIYNTNGGIVIGGGNRLTLVPGENYAENNHIEKFSRITKMYNPAITLSGVGNRASHNIMHDAPHSAITFSGNNNIIEYNEIFDVLQSTDDAGAIYSGKDWTRRGNVIRYNYIHDLQVTDPDVTSVHGIHGVYLDDAYSSAEMTGNVIYNVSGDAFFIGGGRDNVIENNVVINCGRSVYTDQRLLGWASDLADSETGILYQRLRSMPYDQEPWASRYPELANILENEPAKPKNNRIFNNVFVNSGEMRIAIEVMASGIINNNIDFENDPGFVDMSNNNFELRGNSLVYQLIPAFQYIPFNDIGIY